MQLQLKMWLWHVSRQRWLFQLLWSLLSLMNSQQETLPVKYLIFTSRLQTWLHAIRHANAEFRLQCKKLEHHLFLFPWNEERSTFLEACDDLAIYFAALPSLMASRVKTEKSKNSLINSRMVLIVDELPGLEKIVLKGKHWERQLQRAHYQQELMRFHGVQMLKNIVRRTNTLTILVTRQLPQLEHGIWETVRHQGATTHDLSGILNSLVPRWARDFENWLFVMGDDPRSLDPKNILVTLLSPHDGSPLSIDASSTRCFRLKTQVRDDKSHDAFARVVTHWWSVANRLVQ